MSEPDEIRLWCWCPYYDLKIVIQGRKPSFKDIPADSIDLYKFQLPLEDFNEDYAQSINLEDGQELKSFNDVSVYWMKEPGKVLSIILPCPAGDWPPLKCPRMNERWIFYTSSNFDQHVENTLNELRPEIENFIRNRGYMLYWTPPSHVADQTIREFLTGLKIPLNQVGRPSLLFHGLDGAREDNIIFNEIFSDDDLSFVCNTSGSGKTRNLLECLTRHWGFYYVAAKDSHGLARREINKYPHDYSKNYSLHASSVFHLFLDLCKEVNGELTEADKHLWLKFQLSEAINPNITNIMHPFHTVMLSDVPQSFLERIPNLLGHIRKEYLDGNKIVYVIDEAQVAVQTHLSAFFSSGSVQCPRSILRQIIHVASKYPVKLVVSGTGLSLVEDAESTLASGISKTSAEVKLVHRLGGFDNWKSMEPFIRRYVPSTVLETEEGAMLQYRIRQYLTGRYQFLTSFLEHFMMNVFWSPYTLFNQYVKAHINQLPGDNDRYGKNEPPLSVKVKLQTFDWARLNEDPHTLGEIWNIVQSHITGRKVMYGPVSTKAVEYGIAQLREDENRGYEGHIVEPLPFLSLLFWLEKNHHSLDTHIRHREADGSSRGDAFEELVILHLLRSLCIPTPLNGIFDFHGKEPVWSSQKAQLVGRVENTHVPISIPTRQVLNPKISVAHHAEQIEDIVEWLQNPVTATTILIPGILFGPDLLARVQLSDGEIVLLMGQMKCYTRGNKHTLDMSMMESAIRSLHSDHWFKKADPECRSKLKAAVEAYPVLRFIAAFPLEPNFSQVPMVMNAISALGGVPLAGMQVDEMRANFISETEAMDVLVPLLQALHA
ncbi:hypothetical protein APHAL10511_008020 [Amanita phalloides]|nr:hypothetical protein APHAL10511_008020 [Amanita phalloides]